MKAISVLRSMMAILIMLGSFSSIYSPQVQAAFDKPNVVDSKQTTEVGKLVKKGVKFTLYVVMAIGVLGAAMALGMMTPFIGEPEKGKKALKAAIGVVVGAGVFEIFMSWLLSLFF
mgnify:CR=1 FL=1